ncbi:SUMF1/EgtB/PvdO family nonheme iron enzyme [uncultured Methanomethylovorans sp.]|uniref:SUMF1/EgtB/PvdO family nonheme iron enzyme n=1 Tax=uncultured Methanomethylovorans sp. TaxID=183759 RepID=UPI002AA7B536|nr:SUMF1/EgtB/PvdO family nonheme iron enzyme [uncultured Methanomethylovorans sp.]
MESAIKITRETEFYQGYIRFKMAVTNESPYAVNEVTLDFVYDDELLRVDRYEPVYVEKKGKIHLGSIDGGKSKSIAVYFDPQMCSKGTDIECNVAYKDYKGKRYIVQMEPKEISVVCPILKTVSDINAGRLKEIIERLPNRDSRACEVLSGFDINKLISISQEVIEKRNVQHVRTLRTKDNNNCEIWYYGKTKVTNDDIVIMISILAGRHIVELFAATQTAETLTGLLAEVGREIKDSIESTISGKNTVINISIRGSKIDRSNLLDLCNMEGTCDVNVVIEGSNLDRTSFGISNDDYKRSFHQEKEHKFEEDRLKKEREADKKREEAERTHVKEKEATSRKILVTAVSTQKTITPTESNSAWKSYVIVFIVVIAGIMIFGTLFGDKPLSPSTLSSSNVSKSTATVDKTDAVTSMQGNLETYTNSIGMEFVLIPAGEFMMGSTDGYDNEKPVQKITIGQSYYLGKYEVTQEQWGEVMGDTPSYYKGDNCPMESVSWGDVQEFVKKLNAKEGTGSYRLPSEAEWEYACRAGTTTRYSFGDSDSKLGDYAWYNDNSGDKTHPVGQKKPNPWGLYDMNGNVWELVQDNWHADHEGAPGNGSAWEDGSSFSQVGRGGCWSNDARSCRSAVRSCFGPGSSVSFNYVGFRLLREV